MAERRQGTRRQGARRNDDIARFVIGIMVSANGERMDFNHLQSQLNIKSRPKLLEYLGNYPDLFAVSCERGRSEIVSLIVQVNLCPDYCSESNCHDIDCDKFHICKFYILSDGCLSKINSCKYGHDLNSPHNSKLFSALLLDDLPSKYLQKLFLLPRNRNEASIPRICSFYNVQAGCSKKGKCTSLHICEHYVWGNCKFGRAKCNRSHDILDNEKILKRFGLNTKRNPSAILKEIKEMYDMTEDKRNDSEVDYDDETRGPRDSFHSSVDQYTPRSQMPEIFHKMTLDDIPTSPTYNRQQEQQLNRRDTRPTFFKPIQQSRNQPTYPSNQPIQPSYKQPFIRYPDLQRRQPDQRSRQRYNSESNHARDNPRPSCHTRSKSHRPENRNLYSPARRFGSSANISTQPKEPVICQYYLDGYCRYKNHCKNLHPPKDSDSSDSEGQGDSDTDYESD